MDVDLPLVDRKLECDCTFAVGVDAEVHVHGPSVMLGFCAGVLD